MTNVAEEKGLLGATLYKLQGQVKVKGLAVSGGEPNSELRSTQDKFPIVLETATVKRNGVSGILSVEGLYITGSPDLS